MGMHLVTGGAGFVGSHIATALVERGDRVRVLDNLSTGHRHNLDHLSGCVDLMLGDVADRADVERAMRDVEVVYHQAALASVPRSVTTPLDTHATCVTGTLNVLEAARQCGVRRVVYAASSSAYGDAPPAAKHEALLPAPVSPYAAAKLAGELYCQVFTAAYGLETVCLRYFNVFGPRQDPNSPYAAVIPKFIVEMLAGRPPTVFGDGSQTRDFVYVKDVARANLLAAEAKRAVGRTINIASGQKRTVSELVVQINCLLGSRIEPAFAQPRPGDVLQSIADVRLARELLDFESAITFEEGLRRTVEFFQSARQQVDGRNSHE